MEMDLKTHKTCKNTLNNHRGFSKLGTHGRDSTKLDYKLFIESGKLKTFAIPF